MAQHSDQQKEYNESLGIVCKQIRQTKQISQLKLAELAGLDTKSVERFENEKKNGARK